MQIQKDSEVSIHYILKNDQGEVLDSSEGREALSYIAGSGQIIPGLDNALMGKKAGEHIDVTIEPHEAYGEFQEALINEFPKEQFQNAPDLQEGMIVQAQSEHGVLTFWVKSISDTHVTLDGNHPLAGQRLHFSVDVVSVNNPSGIILPN